MCIVQVDLNHTFVTVYIFIIIIFFLGKVICKHKCNVYFFITKSQ